MYAPAWSGNGRTRDAAIRPNKPDRLRAEFWLFNLVLALLLIKSPFQPRLQPGIDFGSSEKLYLVVYIRFVVNRVAFYVPLLEHPLALENLSALGTQVLRSCRTQGGL